MHPLSFLEMGKEIVNLQLEKQAEIDIKISEMLGNFLKVYSLWINHHFKLL